MLIGERRMGKTSLLMRLHRQLELPFIPIYVDLVALPSQTEGLLNGILRNVADILLEQGLISPEHWESYSITYAHDFSKALESILDEVEEKSEDIKIVLMLDEAERLLESGSQTTGVLRATLMTNQDVVAIIAGTSQLLEIPEDSLGSPLFNIFRILTLRPWSREDTKSFIVELSKQVGVTYEHDALERIYELSGGLPFYVQAIGYQLIELANEEPKDKIRLEDVNKIIPKIFEMLSYFFQYSLHRLDDEEKAILATIANGNSLRDVDKQDVKSLEIKQIIVEDRGNYRFVSQLFGEWFKQHVLSD